MESNFEAVKYINAKKVKETIDRYGYSVEPSAKQIIETARPEDIISLKLTINSPLKIVRAVNVSKEPDAIFQVAEE